MALRKILPVLIAVLLCKDGFTQQLLKGKIYNATTDSVITGATVFNATTQKSVLSAKDGSYSISSSENDQIIFSHTGFSPDTIKVAYGMLLVDYNITLQQVMISLKGVTVTNSYQADSLRRREYYQSFYDQKKQRIAGDDRSSGGVGISFSPISYFSGKAKKERQLRKRLKKNEEEAFIDHSFNINLVQSLTPLQGDSLHLFMYMYRPDYSFCRKSGRQEMIVYISNKLVEFRKPKKAIKNN